MGGSPAAYESDEDLWPDKTTTWEKELARTLSSSVLHIPLELY